MGGESLGWVVVESAPSSLLTTFLQWVAPSIAKVACSEPLTAKRAQQNRHTTLRARRERGLNITTDLTVSDRLHGMDARSRIHGSNSAEGGVILNSCRGERQTRACACFELLRACAWLALRVCARVFAASERSRQSELRSAVDNNAR